MNQKRKEIKWAVHIGDGLNEYTLCKFLWNGPRNAWCNLMTDKYHTISSYEQAYKFGDTVLEALEKFDLQMQKECLDLRNKADFFSSLPIQLYLKAELSGIS